MIEELLERARKRAQEAEVYEATAEESPVLFEANRVKQLQTRHSRVLALRVIKDGHVGYALARGGSNDLVARAVEASRFGPQARFQMPPSVPPGPAQVYDPQVDKVSPEEMVGLGEDLIGRLVAHTPGLLCMARLSKAVVTVRLANSRGAQTSYRKSLFSVDVEGTLIRGTDMLFAGDGESSCHPIRAVDIVAREVMRQLEMARRTASPPGPGQPVILYPRGVMSAFYWPLAVAFNGRVVLQGASPLARRQGEKVFAPAFSLWDDATIPFHPLSRPWDDEGVPCQKTPLVEKGVVGQFLYDLQTAGLAGARSTGSASRQMGTQPSPSVSALVVSEGETSLEEMVRGMREGLLVEQLMGAEQGNILGGEFSGNVLLGYKIEKGEVVGRVKDTMVSGNIYQCLKEGVVVGKGGRWVDGLLYTPPLYLSTLSVASKG